MRLATAALAAACLWSAVARGASQDGQFAVKGIGIQGCAEFTKAYAERSRGAFVFAGWLDGYISAFNRLQPNTFDAVPWQSTNLLLALIKNHCATKPRERLFTVVQALLGVFSGQSLTATSPSVEAKAGGKKVSLYREVLRQAQQALAAAGDYSGKPDGMFGPKTKAAFEAFQERSGLPKTGLPNQETLYRLLAPKTPAP